MTYLNLSRKNSSSNERCVSMNGTQLPEGLWLTCRRQPMSLSDSILYLGQKLDTVDHSLRGVTDVQWPTFDVMNCIIYLHAIPQVVFKRLRGCWISFCTEGFSESAAVDSKQSMFASSYHVAASEMQHCSFCLCWGLEITTLILFT